MLVRNSWFQDFAIEPTRLQLQVDNTYRTLSVGR